MKVYKKIILIPGLLIILNSLTPVLAQDWPQWRGTDRDSRVTGFDAPQNWPAELIEQWKVKVGYGDATPALVNGKLFVFTRIEGDEVLQCLDASTGKVLWKESYPAEAVTGPAARHPGPRSTPTVTEGKVVIIGATGIISCVDAETGKLLWRNSDYANIVPVYFTGMSPLVAGGRCYAHLGGPAKSAIIAFDLAKGSILWKYEGEGPAYASPGLMSIDKSNLVVMQTDSALVAFNSTDGRLMWKVVTPPMRRYYNSSSPIIKGNIIFYSGEGKGTAALAIKKDGASYSVEGLWRNPDIGNTYNTAVLKEGYLYGFSDRGYLYCLDSKSGQTAWADTVRHRDFGSVIDAGKVLIGLSSTSNLVVFEPVTDKYSEIALIKVSDTPTYAHPIISGNRIFIKDEEYLILYNVD